MFNTGTVSHGTFRIPDLLSSFTEALEQLCESGEARDKTAIIPEAKAYGSLLQKGGWAAEINHDDLDSILDRLFDALNEVAVKHNCYFGSHPGDGSDFGFWPNDEIDY